MPRRASIGGSRRGAPALAPILAACAALVLPGCVERYLVLDSNPTGARIAVNGEELPAPAPCRLDFDHYGTFRVDAWHPKREGVTQFVVVDPPWYQRFPIDLVTDLLLPFTIEDRREVRIEFPLEETAAPGSGLLDAAEQLRGESR